MPGRFEKKYVGIIYGLTLEEIDKQHGGLAMLSPTNVIDLNDFDRYLGELKDRIKDAANA